MIRYIDTVAHYSYNPASFLVCGPRVSEDVNEFRATAQISDGQPRLGTNSALTVFLVELK